uniref:Uncharacterized protein n=1 Tax=Arundo donax TaxID=35708 RepID=A0A0A9HN89_ARUDO
MFHIRVCLGGRWIFSNRYSICGSGNAESIEVVSYEFGQKYDTHFGYCHDKINLKRGDH